MNLGSLVSETRNPQTMDLDALSTLELVNRFNQQDTLVAQAVKETLPEVALFTWARAPADVWGFWMPPNVRQPLAFRTAW